jgi:tRNA(Met) C34 N-acetyltransferase TmcA
MAKPPNPHTTINVLVTGETGRGKTLVGGLMALALRRIGVPVEYSGPDFPDTASFFEHISKKLDQMPEIMEHLVSEGMVVKFTEQGIRVTTTVSERSIPGPDEADAPNYDLDDDCEGDHPWDD